MSEVKPTSANKFAKTAVVDPSHVEEILKTLPREPGDRVTCVHVYGDFYRCNWWAPGAGPKNERIIAGLEVSTYRVRQSRFVSATLSGGRLDIRDKVPAAAKN